MAQLTVAQYDTIEAAIRDGRRLVVRRQHQDIVVIPERLVLRNRREAIEARHPTTGDRIVLFIDEAEGIEVVR
jgi:hypothetical protein